jgi:hypothetical protein
MLTLQNTIGRTLRVKFNVDDYVVLEKDLLGYRSVQKEGQTQSLNIQSVSPIVESGSVIGSEELSYETAYIKNVEALGETSSVSAAHIDGRTKVTSQLAQIIEYQKPNGASWKDITSADVLRVPEDITAGRYF